jgi:hypothetical protein
MSRVVDDFKHDEKIMNYIKLKSSHQQSYDTSQLKNQMSSNDS